MTTSNKASDAIASACSDSGVRFFDVTEEFRARANETPLFFELDGHLNLTGHEAFARLLTPVLENYLSGKF
jgi:lysophospholipase L1-like esterase